MYDGGKNGEGTFHKIINKVPPHLRYIEGFLGSGGIMNNISPASEIFGIERNPATIQQFKYPTSATIINGCFFEWAEENRHLFTPETFLYCDPPYPINSRRQKIGIYKYELTDLDHYRLLTLLLSLPCMVAISTYRNDLYSDLLKEWNLYTFNSQTRKGTALELLYMNYPEPVSLHDYTHLGKDWIDRQRIKRKIAREVNKLNSLPALEREAVLRGIQKRVGIP